jgi:NADH-quinone oxidoreductase subunit K
MEQNLDQSFTLSTPPLPQPPALEQVLYGSITVSDYVMLAALLFVVGVCGIFLNRKNIITLLMSIELMLLAVNINFVAFSVYLGDLTGQVFTLLVLTVAAAEAAIGLAILVVYFRNRGTIDVDDISALKG